VIVHEYIKPVIKSPRQSIFNNISLSIDDYYAVERNRTGGSYCVIGAGFVAIGSWLIWFATTKRTITVRSADSNYYVCEHKLNPPTL
jgi:hypothetical protein